MAAKKRALVIVGIVVAAILLILIITPFFINADTFRPQIEQALGGMLGRKVEIGHLRVSLWSGGLVADRIVIADDPGYSREPFLTAKSLSVGVALWPLIFSRQLEAHSLTIADPHVQLLRTARGDWNFATIGGKAPPRHERDAKSPSGAGLNGFTVDKVRISDGTISFGRAGQPTRLAYDHVNIGADNLSETSAFPLRFAADTPGDGKLSLQAKVGPLGTGNANRLPFKGQMKADNVPAEDVQNLLEVLGYSLPDGSSLRGGTIKANMTLDGPLERIVTSGPVEISNVKLAGFNLASQLAAALGTPGAVSGNDTLIQVASSQLRYAPNGLRAEALNIVIPAIGSITGNGTVDAANHLNFRLVAKLAGSSPLAQLVKLPMLNTGSGNSSGSGAGLPFRIEGTTSRPVIIPDVSGIAGQALKKLIPQQQQKGPIGGILNELLNKKKKPQQPQP
jgi:AsmA protein